MEPRRPGAEATCPRLVHEGVWLVLLGVQYGIVVSRVGEEGADFKGVARVRNAYNVWHNGAV